MLVQVRNNECKYSKRTKMASTDSTNEISMDNDKHEENGELLIHSLQHKNDAAPLDSFKMHPDYYLLVKYRKVFKIKLSYKNCVRLIYRTTLVLDKSNTFFVSFSRLFLYVPVCA